MAVATDVARGYLGKHILLTDQIFCLNVPEEYRGYLFDYVVISFNQKSNRFAARYQNRMIREDGLEWVLDAEDGVDSFDLDGLKHTTLVEGGELYHQAVERVNA